MRSREETKIQFAIRMLWTGWINTFPETCSFSYQRLNLFHAFLNLEDLGMYSKMAEGHTVLHTGIL